MTKRVSELIGKPVLSADGGERLGTVSDLLLQDDTHQLVGIVVTHGVLRKEQVLPASAVQSFGPDAVVSRSAELVGAKEWRDSHADPTREPD
jgi:uncharacterized protein YrrD